MVSITPDQVELISSLDVPIKLRCAICSKLALNAFRLPCCEQGICETCHSSLPLSCPVCEHSPLSVDDCPPNKSLRTTIKVFLRTEEKKRESNRAKDLPLPPPNIPRDIVPSLACVSNTHTTACLPSLSEDHTECPKTLANVKYPILRSPGKRLCAEISEKDKLGYMDQEGIIIKTPRAQSISPGTSEIIDKAKNIHASSKSFNNTTCGIEENKQQAFRRQVCETEQDQNDREPATVSRGTNLACRLLDSSDFSNTDINNLPIMMNFGSGGFQQFPLIGYDPSSMMLMNGVYGQDMDMSSMVFVTGSGDMRSIWAGQLWEATRNNLTHLDAGFGIGDIVASNSSFQTGYNNQHNYYALQNHLHGLQSTITGHVESHDRGRSFTRYSGGYDRDAYSAQYLSNVTNSSNFLRDGHPYNSLQGEYNQLPLQEQQYKPEYVTFSENVATNIIRCQNDGRLKPRDSSSTEEGKKRSNSQDGNPISQPGQDFNAPALECLSHEYQNPTEHTNKHESVPHRSFRVCSRSEQFLSDSLPLNTPTGPKAMRQGLPNTSVLNLRARGLVFQNNMGNSSEATDPILSQKSSPRVIDDRQGFYRITDSTRDDNAKDKADASSQSRSPTKTTRQCSRQHRHRSLSMSSENDRVHNDIDDFRKENLRNCSSPLNRNDKYRCTTFTRTYYNHSSQPRSFDNQTTNIEYGRENDRKLWSHNKDRRLDQDFNRVDVPRHELIMSRKDKEHESTPRHRHDRGKERCYGREKEKYERHKTCNYGHDRENERDRSYHHHRDRIRIKERDSDREKEREKVKSKLRQMKVDKNFKRDWYEKYSIQKKEYCHAIGKMEDVSTGTESSITTGFDEKMKDKYRVQPKPANELEHSLKQPREKGAMAMSNLSRLTNIDSSSSKTNSTASHSAYKEARDRERLVREAQRIMLAGIKRSRDVRDEGPKDRRKNRCSEQRYD